jgi:hypothetical protein
MRASGEGQMPGGTPADVKKVGIGENLGVTARGGEQEQYQGTSR